MPEEFMTLTAAAEALDVSRFKVSRLIRDGELQAFVSPLDRRQRLVKRSDVETLKHQLIPVEVERGKIAA
jgi:excisionase family DNA binding protein